MKLHEIIPGVLYQRGAFATRPNKVEELRAAGIEVVVSLWHRDPDLVDLFRYQCHPLADGRSFDRVAAHELALQVATHVRAGRPTLVHCHAGRNRSALINALAVRELSGCSGADAAEFVQRKRPRALANPAMLNYLRSLP